MYSRLLKPPKEKSFFLFGPRGTGKIKESMLSGLKAFLRDYPMAKAYLVYGGARRMQFGKIEVLPIETALKELPKLLA